MRYIYLITAIIYLVLTPLTAHSRPAIDYQSVAITIAAEAAGEGPEGMLRVANTIRNRVIKYRMSPDEVVKQPNQYYGYTAKNRIILYNSVCKTADYLACNIMMLEDKTRGALYFRRPNEARRKWHRIETITYRDHIFYK